MRKLSGNPVERGLRSLPALPGVTAIALACLTLNGCTPQGNSGAAGGETGDSKTKTAQKEDTHNQIDPDDSDDRRESEDGPGLHTRDTRLEFRAQPMPLVAGQRSIWNLKVIDKRTDKGVNVFKLSHEKLMHLIIVSKDLSWFNHVHPEYKGYGSFVLDVTLPRSGEYKLYADYVPMLSQAGKITGTEGRQEVASKEFDVAPAPGSKEAPLPDDARLVADKLNGAWITKTVPSHAEGEAPRPGATNYQVALMPMPRTLKAGQDAMLHFQVRDAKGQPVKDLEPYLGAMGHAVLLSEDSDIYLHTHPMDGEHDMSSMGGAAIPAAAKPVAKASTGPDVMFHTNFPEAGLYKVWAQFRHKGLIVTAPFVLNVEPGAKAAKTGDHGHDHGDGHDHAH